MRQCFLFFILLSCACSEECEIDLVSEILPLRTPVYIRPLQSVSFSFEEAGLITEISVEEGDSVTRGTVLARQDPLLLQIEEERLNSQIEEEKANWLLQKKKLSRRQFNPKAYAPEAVEEQEYAFARADSRLIHSQLALQKLRVRLERQILSPGFSGVVTKRHVDEGEYIQAHQIAFEVFNPNALKLEIQLPPEEAALLPDELTLPQCGSEAQARKMPEIPLLSPEGGMQKTQYHLHHAKSPCYAGLSTEWMLPRPLKRLEIPLSCLKKSTRGYETLLITGKGTSLMLLSGLEQNGRLIPSDWNGPLPVRLKKP